MNKKEILNRLAKYYQYPANKEKPKEFLMKVLVQCRKRHPNAFKEEKIDESIRTCKIIEKMSRKAARNELKRVDWIFYEGQARELFEDANRNGVGAKSITEVDVKWWAGKRNLNIKTLKIAVENTKYKWNDNFNR